MKVKGQSICLGSANFPTIRYNYCLTMNRAGEKGVDLNFASRNGLKLQMCMYVHSFAIRYFIWWSTCVYITPYVIVYMLYGNKATANSRHSFYVQCKQVIRDPLHGQPWWSSHIKTQFQRGRRRLKILQTSSL